MIPTPFDKMRRQRRNAVNRAVVNRHLADVEAFQFEHSQDVEQRLREIDMDAVYAKRPVRRWWHKFFNRGAAA